MAYRKVIKLKMSKNYIIGGIGIIFAVILAFSFVIMQSPGINTNIRSYDDVVNISELIPLNELSQDSLNGTTIVAVFGLWDSNVLDLNDVMKTADLILTGTVDNISESEMTTVNFANDSSNPIPYIYTDVIMNIDKIYKDKTGIKKDRNIVVRIAKGCVEGRCLETEDEASFEIGEKVFLLLTTQDIYTEDIGKEHYKVLAGIHGKFTIVENRGVSYGVREKVAEGHRVYLTDDLTKLASDSK